MLFTVVGKLVCSPVGRNATLKLMDSKEHVTKDTSRDMKLLRHTTVNSSKPRLKMAKFENKNKCYFTCKDVIILVLVVIIIILLCKMM